MNIDKTKTSVCTNFCLKHRVEHKVWEKTYYNLIITPVNLSTSVEISQSYIECIGGTGIRITV